MKNNSKTKINNYLKAASVVLDHFKQPLDVLGAISFFIEHLDPSLRMQCRYSSLDESDKVPPDEILWHLTIIHNAFLKIIKVNGKLTEKQAKEYLEWFSNPGNPEEVYNSLRMVIIHCCHTYGNYGINPLHKTLFKDITPFFNFIMIMREEETRLNEIKDQEKALNISTTIKP